MGIVCNPEDVKKSCPFLHCQAWTGLRNRIQGFWISRSSDPWIFQDGSKCCKICRSTNWKQKGLFCHNLFFFVRIMRPQNAPEKSRYKCIRNWCYVLIENPTLCNKKSSFLRELYNPGEGPMLCMGSKPDKTRPPQLVLGREKVITCFVLTSSFQPICDLIWWQRLRPSS